MAAKAPQPGDATLDESGYIQMTKYATQEQMVQFIERVITSFGYQALPSTTLEDLARKHIKIPDSFQALLQDLAAETAQPPPPTGSTAPSAPHAPSEAAGKPPSSAASSAPCGPGPDAGQALRPGASSAPSSSSAQSAEISLGGLTAENREPSGTLLLVSPPWSLFRSRDFQLVVRNPGNPEVGLLIFTSTDRSEVVAVAQAIYAQLGPSVQSLAEPSFYQALQGNPALLRRLATNAADVATELCIPTAPSEEVHPEEEHGECPICFDEIHPGEAAMRCAGQGGVHHYFHARCLQSWMAACREGREATCPVCRGQLQINGHRLQDFLNGEASSSLSQDDRTYLQNIADGLRGKNRWQQMNKLEKAAYAGGILAAAGWGFMLGYNESNHRATRYLALDVLPQEHRFAQGIGWLVGVLAWYVRKNMQEKEERDRQQRSQEGRRS
ncbi:unnamed protein product [Symbiodinium natans]|uniref:RING-type domain-containing protein n=1 Tax=Symbiodinium natans TaxID=878477 RepID=A0A812UTP7_9DINO|nr:unnamed protein product [Symbiodinium natans]